MDDLSQRIRKANPYAGRPLPDHALRIREEILSGRRKPRWDMEPVQPPRQHRSWRALLLTASGLVAVATVLAIVVLVIVRPQPALSLTPDPLAAAPVDLSVQMLDEEVMQPVVDPTRAQSTRGAEWEGWFLQLDPEQPTAKFIQPQRTRITWSNDLSGVSQIIAGTPANPAGVPIEPIPEGAAEPGSTLYEEVWEPGEIIVPFPAAPPDGVEAMRDYLDDFLTAQSIVTEQDPTAGEYAFAVIALKQSWTLSDSAERAAIATILRAPGVSVAGTTTDRAGRGGVILDLAPTDLQPGYHTQIVIDPETGRLLAVEVTTIDGIPDFAIVPGSVTDYTIWR